MTRIRDARMLEPLRRRDFALLTFGQAISLLGDGFYYLALTWLVYGISNVPTALSMVGLAWTLPSVLFLLVGGAFSDRHDRRRVMIGADVLRGGAIGTMAILAATGGIELWQIAGLVALVGVGDAFFNPASTALVPDLVPEQELASANALAGMYRPLMFRLVGPATAGFVVAAVGPASGLAIDALSFVVSAAAVSRIRHRPAIRAQTGFHLRQILSEVGEGLDFARTTPWIWATLIAAMLGLLVFLGPVEVLTPYLVKNRLGLGPDALGLIFAAGGIGSIGMSVLVGTIGMPRKWITAMYVGFAVGIGLSAAFGLMTALWQGVAVSFVVQASFQLGGVIWTTKLQTLVPRELLGRVSSLDWLVSTGLVPVSFALTGPVSGAIGPETTMVGAGVLGAILMFSLLFVPGVRDPERGDPLSGVPDPPASGPARRAPEPP